jgi:hypothetical protein
MYHLTRCYPVPVKAPAGGETYPAPPGGSLVSPLNVVLPQQPRSPGRFREVLKDVPHIPGKIFYACKANQSKP